MVKSMRVWAGLAVGMILSTRLAEGPVTRLPAGTRIEKNLAYGWHARQKADVYRPSGVQLRPAVLYFHGGGWVGMSKEDVIETHCARWVRAGYVVVNADYRLAWDSPAPAAVLDARAAARWMLANAAEWGIDPGRIVVAGESAGGHLALMTVAAMDQAKYGAGIRAVAVVDWYGPTDLPALSGTRDWLETWLGKRPELARELSPMSYVGMGFPPVIAIHGDADEVVPFEQSVRLVQAMPQAELIRAAHGRHGFDRAQWNSLYDLVFARLQKFTQADRPSRTGGVE